MLPDVLQSALKLVVCGTAVGDKSAQRQAYYAGPGNKFWRTLHSVGLTPLLLAPDQYKLLPQFGIGLTDLCKTKTGVDRAIDDSDFDAPGFEERIKRFAPQFLCFNGKTAAKVWLGVRDVNYGWCDIAIGSTRVFIAPSTSGAANGSWDENLWHHLASSLVR